MSDDHEAIHTRIWEETPEPDDPFAASACHCTGFDVYGDLLGRIRWSEYLYLLLRGDPPTGRQAAILEDLAVAIANPGPRDHSVRAAMNGGVGGSTHAASLMAALAVGAGQYGGAREVALAIGLWQEFGCHLTAWEDHLSGPPPAAAIDVWTDMEHPPGFDPHGVRCTTPVRQTLAHLAGGQPSGALAWLQDNREALETAAGCPLAMTGVAAAAFHELEFDGAEAEMLYLLLRLPGAAAHALEQERNGYRQYPFFRDGLILDEDPGPSGMDDRAGMPAAR